MADVGGELKRKLEICDRVLQRLEREPRRREQTIMAVRNVRALAQSQLDALPRSEQPE